VHDSAPLVLLTQDSLQGRVRLDEGCAALVLGGRPWQQHAWAHECEGNPSAQSIGLRSSHLAYVIYTSGSTGQPKGVMLEHSNATHFVAWAKSAFAPTLLRNTLFSTSINFDLAVFELFVPLSSGTSVTIVNDALSVIPETDVSLINTVPSAASALLDTCMIPPSVRSMNLAGEALKRSLVERLFATTSIESVANLYGPTETTTYSTWVRMERRDGFVAHIGQPIANTKIYILDRHLQPAPIGVTGELYIGGAGVARGYLNRPELTAERFLADPFSDAPGARMYKTGDLARWRADGNIEYLGRTDFQVKIRGFRIELGEIEARLAEVPGIREAVVLAREDSPGNKRLVAYVVGDALEPATLRAQLGQQLPEYMVPSAFVALERLPLTPNGKLDRRALPAPEGEAFAQRLYEAPVGEIEQTLARLWGELLGVERVGRGDNFFELGGHSLLAVRLISRLRQQGAELELQTVLDTRDLQAMASRIAQPNVGMLPNEVVAIRAGSSGRPLFLVHETSGQVLSYKRLARFLDADMPIYGIQAEPSAIADGTTLEELAARYASAIRSVQTQGPYRLAGWSAGGVLAYEVAQQLLGQDESVEFVGLIDSFVPAGRLIDLDTQGKLRTLLQYLRPDVDPREIDRQCRAVDLAIAVDRCRLRGWLTLTLAEVERLFTMNSRLDHANARYRPRPLSAPVCLFTAEKEPSADPSNGWAFLGGANLRIESVGGTHWTILLEDTWAERLAAAVSRRLATPNLDNVARHADRGVAIFRPDNAEAIAHADAEPVSRPEC
jgi:amino acid adenylation domain-containing protein